MTVYRFIILVILLISSLSYSQENWIWQYSTTTEDLYDVFFLDNEKGWIVGNNGTILHTENSGMNWYQQESGTNADLKEVHFLNHNLGWVTGEKILMYTEDGGVNWQKPNIGNIIEAKCLFFVNEQDGWICGSDSVIYKTSNGGGNWEVIPTIVGNFDRIFFLDSKKGWLHSWDDAGYIYMTEDGGHTLKPMSRSRKTFRSFFFLNEINAWACGGSIGELNKIFGWIDISLDGADNWASQFEQGLMHSIHFFDEENGIALGQRNRGIIINKIYDIFLRTIDGGVTWNATEPGGTAFHFLDRNTGWIVGYQGKVYKTINGGGLVNLSNKNEQIIYNFKLSQNYPNPFNPRTTIEYTVRAYDHTPLHVNLSLYNLLGQRVAILVSEKQAAGRYQVEWDAAEMASGIYYYKLTTNKFQDIKKMILMR